MEAQFAKALDNGRIVVVDVKRKRAATHGASRAICSNFKSMALKLNKRRKLDGCKGKSLIRYYSNFMKSGLPDRLMFYQTGEWVDFPQDLISMVKGDFQVKKTAVEVGLDGQRFLLDFLHMIRLDLQTGWQQSIAWIDDAGCCFFPEIHSDDDDEECNLYDGDVQETLENSVEPQEFKLQLEIDINGKDTVQLNECSGGESNLVAVVGSEPELVPMDPDALRTVLFSNLTSCIKADVSMVPHDSSVAMRARLELFNKQVEITKNYRGNSNVQYAWLPVSKDVLPSIMKYGIGHGLKNKSMYGIGVQLAALDFCATSAICCDVDENGEQHMVLCRVVLGNMELVYPGSEQFHPSSENFDSGVDDLQRPKNYIVWHMNMSSHILPEFVVSFKIPPRAQGSTPCQGPPGQLDLNVSAVDAGHDGNVAPNSVKSWENDNVPRAPKSPWMPFPMLFSAISAKVPDNVMKRVYIHYHLFKMKEETREEFIQKLRRIVGDPLLRSTITSLQHLVPSGPSPEKLAANRHEAEEESSNEV